MVSKQRWLRGNIHTHTKYSDGDSPPEVVVNWYAEHGYDFLFLTDHNILIPDAHVEALQRPGLSVWQGEEISLAAVHINGLGLEQLISPDEPYKVLAEPYVTRTPAERLRWAVEQIHAQGGVASVNHPNLWSALTLPDLLEAGAFGILEVANMHTEIAETNAGGANRLSTEQLWDGLLTAGRRVWGAATDDAHNFAVWGPEWANPGRGWLQVEAEPGRLDTCLTALSEGRFYASTGPALAAYRADRHELVLELASGPARIEFIGAEGQVLDAQDGMAARLDLHRVSSPYVRARVLVNGTASLWTQPAFL